MSCVPQATAFLICLLIRIEAPGVTFLTITCVQGQVSRLLRHRGLEFQRRVDGTHDLRQPGLSHLLPGEPAPRVFVAGQPGTVAQLPAHLGWPQVSQLGDLLRRGQKCC